VLEGMRAVAVPQPEPVVWQELRSACFGLVDGGELPAYLFRPTEGRDRAIVLEAAHVVPAPDLPRFRPADLLPAPHAGQQVALEPLRPCDLYQAGRVRSWLARLSADQEDQVGAHAADSARRCPPGHSTRHHR